MVRLCGRRTRHCQFTDERASRWGGAERGRRCECHDWWGTHGGRGGSHGHRHSRWQLNDLFFYNNFHFNIVSALVRPPVNSLLTHLQHRLQAKQRSGHFSTEQATHSLCPQSAEQRDAWVGLQNCLNGRLVRSKHRFAALPAGQQHGAIVRSCALESLSRRIDPLTCLAAQIQTQRAQYAEPCVGAGARHSPMHLARTTRKSLQPDRCLLGSQGGQGQGACLKLHGSPAPAYLVPDQQQSATLGSLKSVDPPAMGWPRCFWPKDHPA